jgi:uncharacterized protein YgbK (DUF1537 family)
MTGPEMTLPLLPKDLVLKGNRVPLEWSEDLLPTIVDQVISSGRKIVVLDDDPTGTQTVHDLPVLTEWSVASLKRELLGGGRTFFILTNSRSLSATDARALANELGTNLKQACDDTQVEIDVISRSDSTLRGHFPDEVDALAAALGIAGRPYLIIPCFFEGGRYTLEDIHYVAEGNWLVPAAQTAYARDGAFGYQSSDLRRWIEEKTGGRIAGRQIVSISLENVRQDGPQSVQKVLCGLPRGSACVVNALGYRDLEVFTTGLLAAEREGYRFLFRSAASFVRIRAGLQTQGLLDVGQMGACGIRGGLFVVGSYVPKTSAQVAVLMQGTNLAVLELLVPRLLDERSRIEEIGRVSGQMNLLIESGQDVLVYTSRELIQGADPESSLRIGRRVAESLIAIVKSLRQQPRFLVAKGGITASDIAVKGLAVQRAMVLGQILPGVPVWKLGPESRYPDMAYIVFPGNVGNDEALLMIQQRLAACNGERR